MVKSFTSEVISIFRMLSMSYEYQFYIFILGVGGKAEQNKDVKE